jgi:hypothetical protein
MVLARILERSPPTHTHRPVLRRYAHGGGMGPLRGARTHGLMRRTERVRTYHGTHGTAAPMGYYTFSQAGSESTRRGLTGVRQSCALGSGAGTRGRRRLGCGTRAAVGAWSVFLTTRRVLGGYSEGTHGRVRGPICAGQWNETCAALATGTRRARAREGVLPTIPSTPRRWATAGAAASVLTATCGEGTRTAVRRCVHAHAGVLTDTNGQALARTRTARHRARGGRTEQ